MKLWKRLVPFALSLALLAGCSSTGGSVVPEQEPGTEQEVDLELVAPTQIDDEELEAMYVDRVVMPELRLEEEMVALSASPVATSTMALPVASGTLVKSNDRAIIDYSNTKDGYVMVQFTGTTQTRLKVQVAGPSYDTTKLMYTYNLTPGVWTTFVLSDGNGSYKVTVYEQKADTGKYAQVVSQAFDVAMTDEFAPFLRPNQYVDHASAPNTVAKAQELAGTESDPLKKVEKIYNFVVNNLTYDTQLAATVQSGYLPVLDNVLASKKGICFDYAALMTGMLRSQGVPCKLVTGYVPTGSGTGYHAWISVWSAETGWVEGAVFFNGTSWQRMDPTFASSGNNSQNVLEYIGNGSNYTIDKIY